MKVSLDERVFAAQDSPTTNIFIIYRQCERSSTAAVRQLARDEALKSALRADDPQRVADNFSGGYYAIRRTPLPVWQRLIFALGKRCPRDVHNAVQFGLEYGNITVEIARTILAELGNAEPAEPVEENVVR